jgi:hypothetical protein
MVGYFTGFKHIAGFRDLALKLNHAPLESSASACHPLQQFPV